MEIKAAGIDAALARIAGARGGPEKSGAETPDFAGVLSSALRHVDGAHAQADSIARRFEAGEAGVTLEQAMISMQGANISFQALVHARNRLISAYHDVMNMQV